MLRKKSEAVEPTTTLVREFTMLKIDGGLDA